MKNGSLARGEAHAGTVRIAWEAIGEGPPLVLCHAFAVDRTMWDPQIEYFARTHRVVTFDQRGTGLSDHPDAPADRPDPYTLDSFADDVAAVLEDLGIERTRLLGLSMGAATAMRFAIRWPERVERLVLASAMASRLPDAIIERSKAVLKVLDEEGIEAAYRFYFGGPLFDALSARQDAGEITMSSPLEAFSKMATSHGFEGCYRVTIERPSMAEDLHRITAPTLVLVGELDKHYLDEADAMQQRIPDARKTVVPGVGHAMSTEAPALFNEEVLRFLQSDD